MEHMNTNSWYGYEIQSVTVSEPPDKVRAENLNTALNAIGDGLSIETSLFIYTDNTDQNYYFIETNNQVSKDTGASPSNQIKPILSFFRKQEKFGDVLAYQVISEGWWQKETGDWGWGKPKTFTKYNLLQSDDYDECIIEYFVTKNTKSSNFYNILRSSTGVDLVWDKEICNKITSNEMPEL